MESFLLAGISGSCGLIIGAVIGYYKSRAEFLERLGQTVSKTDCLNCDLRGTVSNIAANLRDGDHAFKAIRADLADVKQEVALLRQAFDREHKLAGHGING